MFQNFALFAHLDVFDNIAFGLRRHGVARAEIERRVARLIGMLRLDGLARRRPAALSGGQQQRVALARALAIDPAIILMDEPFSSLDAKLRETTREELRILQREVGFTAVLVTHDQAEALAISDRVAVMNAGRLEQLGTPQQIYDHPASEFVAGFVGHARQPAARRHPAPGSDQPGRAGNPGRDRRGGGIRSLPRRQQRTLPRCRIVTTDFC